MKFSKPRPEAKSLSVNLPFGIGQIQFEMNNAQRQAAWELYVELTTRIAIQPLDPEHGLLREALKSLYDLFGITRSILRQAGAGVVQGGDQSFGFIAIRVLNEGIRPFTAYWHPRLEAYEQSRPSGVGAFAHEQAWSENTRMRQELENLQKELRNYANALAQIARVPLQE